MTLLDPWSVPLAQFFAHRNLRAWHPSKTFTTSQAEPLPQRIERLRRMWQASSTSKTDALVKIHCDIARNHPVELSLRGSDLFFGLAAALAVDNKIHFEFPEFDLSHTRTAQETSVLVATLIEVETRLRHEQEIQSEHARGLAELLANIVPERLGDGGLFQVPLYSVPGDRQLATAILGNILVGLSTDTQIKSLALSTTSQQLWQNIADASGMTVEQLDAAPHRATLPEDSDLEGEALITAYLGGTPFFDLVMESAPFTISETAWTEHALVLSPSGHGKTQLLQTLVLDFLNDDNPPGMFIIDDQDDANGILNKIQRLDVFDPEHGRLRNRLLILSPEDRPALNFFQMGDGELTPDMLSCFIYLFSTLDASLSSNQTTAVTFILRLLHKIPGANLMTLLEIMDDKSTTKTKYAPLIQQLDPIARAYFDTQFYSSGLKMTKDAVCRRLYSLMANQTFVDMFSAPSNCFDAAECMRSRKIVLINASTRKLGDASTVYARFFISQILAAAIRRGEATERPLSLLIIDEAGPHLDSQTERLLAVARKYQLGLVAATQLLDQIDAKVKAAMYAGTRIKFVGPVSHSDASILGREMYSSAEFIRSTKKTETGAEWACFVRNETAKPIKVSAPFGTMERAPQMSAAAHAAMRAANKAKVVATKAAPVMAPPVEAPTPPAASAPVATPKPSTDPAMPSEW